MSGDRPTQNQLLDALPERDFERLVTRSELIEVSNRQTLFEAEDQVDYVWFPETGLASVVSIMLSGAAVETSCVGREGGVGFIEACGSGITFSRTFVQTPGRFRRIPASAYREAYDASPDLRRTIHDHIELLTIELRQNVACHALHPVEKRLAWWLLECLDRSGGINPLPLTQEFLANMMGVQRTTINDKASVLQGEGLIEYKRGRIDILNPAGLERRACECRKTVQHFREQVEERRRQLTCD